MRILADMCVDVRIVDWIRQQGHDATHLREDRLYRMPNGEIFAKAASEDRIVLTFDLDFGEIAALSSGVTAGIVFGHLGTGVLRFVAPGHLSFAP